MSKKLEEAEETRDASRTEMCLALRDEFPRDSKVMVRLSSRQQTPTHAKVVSWCGGDGRVLVESEGWRHNRWVPWRQVIKVKG